MSEIKTDSVTFEQLLNDIQNEEFSVYERSHMIEFLTVFEPNIHISQFLLKLLNESTNDVFVESAAIACLGHPDVAIKEKLNEIAADNSYNESTRQTCLVVLNNLFSD